MAAAYSMDLRTRVLKDADAGLSSKELAERYHVSLTWVDATCFFRKAPQGAPTSSPYQNVSWPPTWRMRASRIVTGDSQFGPNLVCMV